MENNEILSEEEQINKVFANIGTLYNINKYHWMMAVEKLQSLGILDAEKKLHARYTYVIKQVDISFENVMQAERDPIHREWYWNQEETRLKYNGISIEYVREKRRMLEEKIERMQRTLDNLKL